MADIFREIDEEVRREKAAALWRKYGNVLIAVAVVIVAAVAGWQFWQAQQNRKAQAVGAQFESALKASRDGQPAEALALLGEVMATGTPGYRLLARLRAAGEAAKRDAAEGAAAFDALAEDTSLDPMYRELARLRAAIIRIDLLPYAELRTVLEPLTAANGVWRHSAREFLGIAALKANLFEDAGRWFDAAITDPQAPRDLRQRVELYLSLVRGGPVTVRN